MAETIHEILVDVATQTLCLFEDGRICKEYAISTAAKGTGQQLGSEQTPLGKHIVRARIGADQPENTVFVARRPTGEIYDRSLRHRYPDRDWILTRILWLSGREHGFNRLGDVDTMRRFVYIHGSPEDDEIGKPGSHGCIKMRNKDVIDLFDRVSVGTPVDIVSSSAP